jgi:hypothetical protein
MTQLFRIAGTAILFLTMTGCFAYRGPVGVEDSLERSLGVDLKRDIGIKLGPISTRIVGSLAANEEDLDIDFRDLTSVGVVVFERGAGNGRTPRRVVPEDLGLRGYTTMLSSSDGDEQVLIMVKPSGASIHEMVLLAVDTDEVVVARVTGHVDKLLAKALDDAKTEGAHGARGAVSFAK